MLRLAASIAAGVLVDLEQDRGLSRHACGCSITIFTDDWEHTEGRITLARKTS
jgi:hypothetical protein